MEQDLWSLLLSLPDTLKRAPFFSFLAPLACKATELDPEGAEDRVAHTTKVKIPLGQILTCMCRKGKREQNAKKELDEFPKHHD